jgi:diacylglycerol O-acyltransferase / wax synthase
MKVLVTAATKHGATGRVDRHHAPADGIAGTALAQRLLDPAPDITVTVQPWQPTPPPGALALVVDAAVSRLAAVATALRHLPSAPRAVRAAGRDAAATRAALAHSAPATSPDQPIGTGRQLAVIRRPLERVRQAGHAHGATVNDVLLAAVAGELAISIQVDDAVADLSTLAAGVADHLDQLTASGRLPALAGRHA